MTNRILSNFSEVLNDLRKHPEKCVLFLGNGFSSGFDNKFTYSLIKGKISDEIRLESPELADFLITTQTDNIEEILLYYIYAINSLQALNEFYFKIKDIDTIMNKINEHKAILYKEFLTAFDQNHPKRLGGDHETKILNCARNLISFNKNTEHCIISQIYTTNYDLVLYWVLQQSNDIFLHEFSENHHFVDAFSLDPKSNKGFDCEAMDKINLTEDLYVLFGPKNNHINVHYLHGAIHIYDIATHTLKIRKYGNKNSIFSLQDIIKTFKNIIKKYNINEIRPTIVFEGLSEFKEKYIAGSMYLTDIYNRFGQLKGQNIVIYGCQLIDAHNENDFVDIHIWRRVFKNKKFKRIYIGIYSENHSEAFNISKKNILDCVKKWRNSKDVDDIIFFSSKTMPTIWDEISIS